MIRFDWGSHQWVLRFHHERTRSVRSSRASPSVMVTRTKTLWRTEAELLQLLPEDHRFPDRQNWRSFDHFTARCSPKDTYNRRTGNFVALGKLLAPYARKRTLRDGTLDWVTMRANNRWRKVPEESIEPQPDFAMAVWSAFVARRKRPSPPQAPVAGLGEPPQQ